MDRIAVPNQSGWCDEGGHDREQAQRRIILLRLRVLANEPKILASARERLRLAPIALDLLAAPGI